MSNLRLAPIGEGQYKEYVAPNSDYEGEVWEIPLSKFDINKPSHYTEKLKWANKPRIRKKRKIPRITRKKKNNVKIEQTHDNNTT